MNCSLLYTTVQETTRLEVKRCLSPIDISGGCHASYVYVESNFVYTIACPVIFKAPLNKTNNYEKNTSYAINYTTINTTNATNSSSFFTSNFSKHSNGSIYNESINIKSNLSNYSVDSLDPQQNGTTLLNIFMVLLVCLVLSIIMCAVALYLKKKQKDAKGGKTEKRRPSSIMPAIVRANRQSLHIQREVRSVLKKIINTICRRNGEERYRRPYREPSRQSNPSNPSSSSTVPPVPPRPPRNQLRRKQTLQYLRETNPLTSASRPHSTIQQALQKPAVDFSRAGENRANLLQREAALEQQRQERAQKSRSRRLERIVRLREIHAKRDGKERAEKKEIEEA